ARASESVEEVELQCGECSQPQGRIVSAEPFTAQQPREDQDAEAGIERRRRILTRRPCDEVWAAQLELKQPYYGDPERDVDRIEPLLLAQVTRQRSDQGPRSGETEHADQGADLPSSDPSGGPGFQFEECQQHQPRERIESLACRSPQQVV